jgi:predicted transcriptional regulator
MEITPEETRKILAYLEEKGYVLVDDHRAGVVRITAEGIDAVELGKLSM